MILENTIKQASQLLKNKNIISHELDVQVILSDIMGVTRDFFIANSHINVSINTIKKFNHAIKRRINREPVAYIIGKKEFWSQDFAVNQATLVPRPETELLIYKVVDFFKNKRINVLDIGTGSGCILLSILKELDFSRGVGIDISTKAIKTAQINSKNLNLFHQSKFKVFDISKFNVGKYDLIVSNPPYIPSKDIKNLSKDIINYEPLVALNGGLDGLDLIRKVIYKSNSLLKRNGLLAIEIGFNQYLKVSSLLKQYGFREMSRQCDYNHNVRCIISTKV
ncbi:MAG TPA: peptide chain release factor N(5)-glutamine methyltransferase [Pelagibacteraceae bacterium]|mgnify:FL=1|jgi:release factor glutamine methyltransferase|nr:peptide chain release factor N(5)-glutamine methyltransferase [Pelagibacterales bacterium]HIN07358.1 peptide chain release factor N(5)-glutamine methyltransferase [Pelagibacteraceae bacterium]|tara:strand:- start:14 stop:853 length:840 start_codon:yes stop_codon:yes gene_type:complete